MPAFANYNGFGDREGLSKLALASVSRQATTSIILRQLAAITFIRKPHLRARLPFAKGQHKIFIKMMTQRRLSFEKAFNYKPENALSTSLHYSARYGIMPVLTFLLEDNSNVNAQDAMGRTPLMMAITGRHEEAIELLLAAESDFFILNNERKSALHMFFADHKLTPRLRKIFLQEFRKKCSSNEDAAKIMIDAGCHLYQAAYLKDAKILEHMLERGLPSNSINPLNDQTVLHIAVKLDDVESVKLLLKYGADVEAVDAEGRTPLNYLYHYTIEHSREKLEILKILLELDASPTSFTSEGFFQMEGILAHGSSHEINLVLQSDLDFAAKDKYDGRSILHYLAVNGNPEVIQVLKHHIHKFDVNVLDKSGVNPLYCAIVNGNYRMVEFLLEQGTKPAFSSPISYCAPLYYAYKRAKKGFENRYDQCVELLLQHDADPQFIINKQVSGEKLTIFDVVPDASTEVISFDRAKPIIAHLAVLESRGTPISEITRSKINSRRPLKKYFNKCRRVLGKEICDLITVFKLLTANEKKMAKYLNKKELVLKLKRIGYKHKVRSSYTYYYNTLKKCFFKGMLHKTLRDKAAKVVSSKIFEDRVDKTNIITENVIDYLNDTDLRQVYQVDLKETR